MSGHYPARSAIRAAAPAIIVLALAARVHLTGPALAAIYLGQITRWNDPAITALNPGLSLPDAAKERSRARSRLHQETEAA